MTSSRAKKAIPFAVTDSLSNADFQRIAAYILAHAGIQLNESKKAMVEGRLRRRMRALGLSSIDDYCRTVFEAEGMEDEAISLVDALTTNKTDFFREPSHFRYLTDIALPALVQRGIGTSRPVRVWSAASSIGAEPYTIAMVMAEFARTRPRFHYEITASDISTDVLNKAVRGVFPEAMADPIPQELRKRYLLRSRDRAAAQIRMVPELRRAVTFKHINLMDDSYPVNAAQDVIFCRNLLIYFEKATQRSVLLKLCQYMAPGGYLILGHSESLAGMGLPLSSVGGTVFVRGDSHE